MPSAHLLSYIPHEKNTFYSLGFSVCLEGFLCREQLWGGVFPISLTVGATTTAKEHPSSSTVPLTTKHYSENLVQLNCFGRRNFKHFKNRQESRTWFCLSRLPCCLEIFCQFFWRYIHHQPCRSAEYFVGLRKKELVIPIGPPTLSCF